MTVYKVTGNTPYRGHRPGEEFEADLTEEQERRAKERGSIRVVRRQPKEEDQPTPDQEEEVDDA